MKITIATCEYEPSFINCKLVLSDAQRAHVSKKILESTSCSIFEQFTDPDSAEGLGCAGDYTIGEEVAVVSLNCVDDCDLCITLWKRGRSSDDDLDLWSLMDDPCEHMWIDFVPFVKELLQ